MQEECPQGLLSVREAHPHLGLGTREIREKAIDTKRNTTSTSISMDSRIQQIHECFASGHHLLKCKPAHPIEACYFLMSSKDIAVQDLLTSASTQPTDHISRAGPNLSPTTTFHLSNKERRGQHRSENICYQRKFTFWLPSLSLPLSYAHKHKYI